MRVGVVLEAQPFPEARKPAIKLSIDFGPLGIKRSSAQITERYVPGDLVGRRVIAVVNFPPKRIGPFVSEVLVLGAYGAGGEVILLRPDFEVLPKSMEGQRRLLERIREIAGERPPKPRRMSNRRLGIIAAIAVSAAALAKTILDIVFPPKGNHP